MATGTPIAEFDPASMANRIVLPSLPELRGLQEIIDLQTRELNRLKKFAEEHRKLVQWRDGIVAEDLADKIDVRLEDYQDDGGGRSAVAIDQESVAIDLSCEQEEGDFIPSVVIVTKDLEDGDTCRLRLTLRATHLVYDVELASS